MITAAPTFGPAYIIKRSEALLISDRISRGSLGDGLSVRDWDGDWISGSVLGSMGLVFVSCAGCLIAEGLMKSYDGGCCSGGFGVVLNVLIECDNSRCCNGIMLVGTSSTPAIDVILYQLRLGTPTIQQLTHLNHTHTSTNSTPRANTP